VTSLVFVFTGLVGYDLQSTLSFILSSFSGKSKFETTCDVTVRSCYILLRNFPVQAVWHVNDTDYECDVANPYALEHALNY
jgi:hypothetical protein